jgi:hypothetical protein
VVTVVCKKWKIDAVLFIVEIEQRSHSFSKFYKQEIPRRKFHFTKKEPLGIFR